MQYWIQQYKLPTDQVHTSMKTLKLLQSIRWHQTANKGYVPNSDLPNTFMAVALDTFDPLVDDWRGGKTFAGNYKQKVLPVKQNTEPLLISLQAFIQLTNKL